MLQYLSYKKFFRTNYFFQLITENTHGEGGSNYLTRYLKKGNMFNNLYLIEGFSQEGKRHFFNV